MAPLIPIFPSTDLPDRVQIVHSAFKEKRRKGDPIDLEKCALLELVQYSCNPPSEGIQAPGVVKCKPVVRLFRRCVHLIYTLVDFYLGEVSVFLCFCKGTD